MLWANTVLASGSAVALVVYTGKDTKTILNTTLPRWKRGVVDAELNYLAKLLFGLMTLCTLTLFVLSGSAGVPRLFRYLLLLSPMIPISLRVNLDLARIYYAWLISTDRTLPGVTARNSNLPEELGRVQVLLCDKTGTLTKNEMSFKKLSLLTQTFSTAEPSDLACMQQLCSAEAKSALKECVMALALCHNVTPVSSEYGRLEYQASSPDEVALVSFARALGLELTERTTDCIVVRTASQALEIYKVLAVFPFTSYRKRMGVIVQRKASGEIVFYLKGAEEAIQDNVSLLDKARILEECEGFAREGLRTLVVSRKSLSEAEFKSWKTLYDAAGLALEGREHKVERLVEKLEENMTALGVTGVEDKLQEAVPSTVENMRNAGVKVWMLTGDKIETAQCIASSTRLKGRDHSWCVIKEQTDCEVLANILTQLRHSKNKVPVIDGISLETLLTKLKKEFVEACIDCPSVVCCRVSPTQKAEVATALKALTSLRVCAIGDGGNDVSMIQSAHIGIGIEGKEGKQAALASDFSVTDFQSLNMLLLWHGRLSYKRTAKLAHFIFHRGLILAVVQSYFMSLFYFNALPLFTGFLLLGYSSYYTNLPVLSVIMDSDTDVKSVLKFPLLYRSLQTGRALNLSMFAWVLWKSLYQGSVIILGILLLYNDRSFTDFAGLAFTSLILTEQLNVASAVLVT
jgi:phospholipid-translocating ATPase